MAVIQHLIVEEYGVHVGKYSQRLKVTKKGKTLTQAPFIHLESLTIANDGVSLSSATIQECTERGIPIYFIDGLGKPYASLYSSGLTGTAATRRAQLEAFHTSRGLQLVLAFGSGKLINQSNLLKYIAKYRKDNQPELFQDLHWRADEILDQLISLEKIRDYPEVIEDNAVLDDFRCEIMGLEGQAAKIYWGAIGMVLPKQYSFNGRKGRGAIDPVNSALNYGYGILYGHCERCLVLAGLDPYAGFLHVDRPGKPSLNLDFIEEFRQPVVDRVVIGMANRKMKFDLDDENRLTPEFRKILADNIRERLDCGTLYEGKRQPLRNVIQKQARHLATFLRGERGQYKPYTMPW